MMYGIWNRGPSGHRRAEGRTSLLARRYAGLDGTALLRPMIETEFAGRIALVSSFGAEAALVLDMVARVDPATPVIFLDTGKHFPETLTYRDILVRRLGLRDVRIVEPDAAALAAADPRGDLWRTSPDRCCALRKVAPLEAALAGFDAWITGRKRFHGDLRTGLPAVEAVDGRIKVNPVAGWSQARLRAAFARRGLPPHPLADQGFPSIGCAPCTNPVSDGQPVRAGRWTGNGKTECGIHNARRPGAGRSAGLNA